MDREDGINAAEVRRKIIRNDVLRKAGCKVKERDNKGKWNLAFIYQGTKYYANDDNDMAKLIRRLYPYSLRVLESKGKGVVRWIVQEEGTMYM